MEERTNMAHSRTVQQLILSYRLIAKALLGGLQFLPPLRDRPPGGRSTVSRCGAVRSEAVVRAITTIVASGSRPAPETPFGLHSGLEVDVKSCIRHAAPTGGWLDHARRGACSSVCHRRVTSADRVGGLCDQSVCFLTRRRGARRGASAVQDADWDSVSRHRT
jgi:hypothetical protein